MSDYSSESGKKERIKQYQLTDRAGKFLVRRESGKGKDNTVVVKKEILSSDGDRSKVFERSIIISKKGKVKNVPVIIPQVSQYSVWFEGKRYLSEMTLNGNDLLHIKYHGPDQNDFHEMNVTIPQGTGVRCFFGQLLECAKSTGFISRATAEGAGQMNFHLIWDGHPYIQEQYTGLSNRPISKAKLEYDGKTEKGERRFALSTSGQTIFYVLDNFDQLKKMFWVSEGLTMSSFDSNISRYEIPQRKLRKEKRQEKIEDSLDNNFADDIDGDEEDL